MKATGSAPVETAGGTIVSPLSFISAAAGVVLAAELVKYRTPSLTQFALDNYFRFDTLYAPNPSFKQVKPQAAPNRCICSELDFVDVYRRRFSSTVRIHPGP
jgi:hypothetical protein